LDVPSTNTASRMFNMFCMILFAHEKLAELL